MTAVREPRIRIEDLPALQQLTEEEAALIIGAGKFRPTLEGMEDRRVMSATPWSTAAQAALTVNFDVGLIDCAVTSKGQSQLNYDMNQLNNAIDTLNPSQAIQDAKTLESDIGIYVGGNNNILVTDILTSSVNKDVNAVISDLQSIPSAATTTSQRATLAAPTVQGQMTAAKEVLFTWNSVSGAYAYNVQQCVNNQWETVVETNKTGVNISVNPGSTYIFRVEALSITANNSSTCFAVGIPSAGQASTTPPSNSGYSTGSGIGITQSQVDQAFTAGLLSGTGLTQSQVNAMYNQGFISSSLQMVHGSGEANNTLDLPI